jgi:hypothetical protein
MNRRPIPKNNNNIYILLFSVALATLYYILIFLPEKKKKEEAEAAAAAEKKKKEAAGLSASSTGGTGGTGGTLSENNIKLNSIKTRLTNYPIKMHGGVGGVQYDFDCDSTIDDFINYIGGQHDYNSINGLEIGCMSGKRSNYYGKRRTDGKGREFSSINSNTPFSLFNGKINNTNSLLTSIFKPLAYNKGGINGNPWTHECTGDEITRGVRIRAGDFIDSIGFKCA